MFCVSGIVKYY